MPKSRGRRPLLCQCQSRIPALVQMQELVSRRKERQATGGQGGPAAQRGPVQGRLPAPRVAQGLLQSRMVRWGLGGKGSKGFRQEEASEVERAEGEHSRAAVGGVLVLVLRAQTVQRARPRPRAPRGPHP
jgi:hypothetical protein